MAAPNPPDRIAETKAYIEQLETDVTAGFQEAFGRAPSPSELEVRAQTLAREDGRDYFRDRAFLAEQPGLVGKAVGAVTGAVSEAGGAVLSSAVKAVADRTESVRSQDSSLPSLPIFKPTVKQEGINRFFPGIEKARFGAEELADLIEVGVPLATEAAVLGGSRGAGGLPGKIGSIVLGNLSSEVGAEYIRYANRKASGLPNDLISSNDPTDVALHFAKVAAGGAILGGADVAFNASALKTQRQVYRSALGLGTAESNASIARIERLGAEPNLAQAMTTVLRPIGTSLSVYPMTSKGSIKQSQALVRGIARTTSDAVSRLGDHLVSGVHIADRSRGWFKANDAYVQFARKKGNAAYAALENTLQAAERQYGVQGVFVDHTDAKKEIEDAILKHVAGLPLIATGDPNIPFRLTKTALEKKADYQLLLDAVNLTNEVPPTGYIQLRNQLEDAAARAGGESDPDGRIFTIAAMKMREAVETKMTAPPEVMAAYNAARREWSDYNALANSAAWKHFRLADPKFGAPNKVTDLKPATSAEVVLQNAMKDPDISPEIVGTWWRAAKEGNAVSQFKGAVESHIRSGFRAAVHVPEKGPLAGIETVRVDGLIDFLGADKPDGNKWAANRALIKNAGGDPDELLRFLEDAKVAFPDGIPNPSQTAARRTGLSGLGSAVRFVTGASAVGGGLGGAAGGVSGVLTGVTAAAASFLALTGVGQVMFNPAVLRKMRRVMNGGIDEQGRWRTLWNVAASVGMTRALQNSLQEQGIDPLVTPTRADQLEQMQMNRSARAGMSSLPAPQGGLPAPRNTPPGAPVVRPRN